MWPMFLPHSWQLFISKADQNSHCWVSLSYLLRFRSFWWCESSVNMLLALLCSDIYLRAELCCWQRLVVQQEPQQQEQAGSLPSNPPSFPPPLIHSLLSASLPQTTVLQAKRCMCLESQLHYVMDEDSLNIRHPSQPLDSHRIKLFFYEKSN